MNEKQKKLLIAVAAVIFGMMLFPPFHYTIPQYGYSWTAYGWILGPHNQGTINIGQLLTQWIGVLIVGGIAYFILEDR